MALAISEPTGETADTSNTTSYAMGAFTPSANAILLCFVVTGGTNIDGTMTGGSLTWTLKGRVNWDGGSKDTRVFWAYTGSSPGSCTPTFDCTGDAATGCIMGILEVTGANVSLGDPIRQIATNSGTSTSNPNCTFGASMDTNNAYAAAFGTNEVGGATSTAPTSWTETWDNFIATPDVSASGAYRVNGESGTTVTFTDAGTFSFGVVAVEVYRAGAGPTGSQVAIMMAQNGG